MVLVSILLAKGHYGYDIFEVFETRSEAIHCERQIKKMKSRSYIEQMIENRFI